MFLLKNSHYTIYMEGSVVFFPLPACNEMVVKTVFQRTSIWNGYDYGHIPCFMDFNLINVLNLNSSPFVMYSIRGLIYNVVYIYNGTLQK